MDFDKAYTAKEVAQMLNVSVSSVYEWARTAVDAGGIPSLKLGGSVRIKESDLQNWLDKRMRA